MTFRTLRLLSVLWVVVLSTAAHATERNLDSVVIAWQSGYPNELILSVAGDDDWQLDSDVVVRLLRSGFPPGIIRSMTANAHPTQAELSAAAEPGPRYSVATALPAEPPVEEETVRLEGPEYIDGYVSYSVQTADRLVKTSIVDDGAVTGVFLSVANISGAPFDLFPEHVRLWVGESFMLRKGRSYEVERISPNRYVRRIERAHIFRSVLIGLAAYSMSSTEFTSTTSGTVSYGDERIRYEERTSVRGSTGADKAAAASWAMDAIAASAEREARRLQEAEDFLLRAETLDPGEVTSGIVPFMHQAIEAEHFVVQIVTPDGAVRIPGRTRR